MAAAASDVERPAAEAPGGEETPERPSKRESQSSLNKALEERRKFDGGDDGEGEEHRDPTQITMTEMLKKAKVHMLASACTKWDDQDHKYKFMSVCRTSRRKLGVLGFGVQLYFQFLCQMGVVFLLLTLISLPLLLTNLAGDIVNSEGTQQIFGMLSIANLGSCGPSGSLCSSTALLHDRRAGFTFSFLGLNSDTRVKGLTPIFGTLDGVGLLVFMCFGAYFTRIWIPREKKIHDGINVSPSDFTIHVRHLPAKLPDDEEHRDFAAQLKEHFSNLLKGRCGVTEEDPVHEVVIVRHYYGAIDNYITQGQYLLQKKDLQVRMAKAKEEQKQAKIQKHIDGLNKRIVKMESSFGDNAGKTDEERECTGDAFVILKREMHVDKILHEYRFARSKIFRCCLEQPLKFRGYNISVENAREPSDLFWENMDYGKWKRRARIATTCLMTVIILAVCLIALLYCKMIGVATQATPPQTDLWVVKTLEVNHCLTLCDWTVFSDRLCMSQAGLGSLVNIWDYSGNTTAVNTSVQMACSDGHWSSRSCAAGTSAQSQWIGMQFSANVNPACMMFQQRASNALPTVELYACPSTSVSNLTASQLSQWNPLDHCIGMQDLTPSTAAQGSWSSSGRQLVLSDSSCRRTISYEGAHEALLSKQRELKAADSTLTDEHAHYKASTTDPTMNCYCKQQQTLAGYTSFRAPPYDGTPAKTLCSEWIYYQNLQLTMMATGVLAVCVLNLLLVFIFTYFVIWERHGTFTSQNTSQFVKLFVAQFMNTALIVLIVNANWRQSMEDIWFISALGLGQGTYDDFDSGWFVAVGSGLCLTIAMQVITATTPGIVMSYIVNPLFICFFRMGLTTQKAINQVYVYPEWNLANRLAQTMTVIFVILMYSGGMPILNFIGFLYCLTAYWMDKWCLLKGSLKPPAYDGTLIKISAHMFPIAAFLHAIVTLWCFGNQNVFPADWSVLQSLFGNLINMDETRYTSLVEDYYLASEARRNSIFFDFLHARILDFTRWSCWLLLCIFLVFCVYYVLTLLNAFIFRPVLAPVYIYINGTCRSKADGDGAHGAYSDTFESQHKEMLDNGLIPSYSVYENPRYSVVLAHLQDGSKEVEAAKAELEVSQAAEAAAKEAAAAKKEAEAAAKAKPAEKEGEKKAEDPESSV